MHRSIRILGLGLALMGLAAMAAFALPTGVTTVNVSSTELDTLQVPTQVGLVFPGITGANYTQATAANVGGVVFSSNTAGRTIEAAAASFTGTNHAIHLQMKVGTGSFADLTTVTGAAAATPITVANANTVVGTNTYDLAWTADAAVGGIDAGTVYTTAVTFTVSAP